MKLNSLRMALLAVLLTLTACKSGIENCAEEILPVECLDMDGDGYWAANCNAAEMTYPDYQVDCNDEDASRNPGEVDICDGVDNDCDGLIDEGFDNDEDNYRDYSQCLGAYPEEELDCDDNDPMVSPIAAEILDGADNDCDGKYDEDFDDDNDGWVIDDCGPDDPLINPGMNELCGEDGTGNGIDDDCDGNLDEFCE